MPKCSPLCRNGSRDAARTEYIQGMLEGYRRIRTMVVKGESQGRETHDGDRMGRRLFLKDNISPTNIQS